MSKLLKLRKYLLGYDTYFRHKRIAKLCGNVWGKQLLDVGGEGKLALFLAGAQVTTVNPNYGEINCDGRNLPFADKSFDIVVSLDVLEHVPRDDRGRFIAELLRVAREKVVFCAALGSSEHEAYARRMADLYRNKSHQICKHLEEHIALGMPTLLEFKNYLNDTDYHIIYENILGLSENIRVIRSWQTGIPLVDKLLLVPKLMFNILHTLYMETFVYKKTISEMPTKKTNRFYVVIGKKHHA